MATTPFSKLAYQTLQQGKGLAGLVHKDLSTRLMSLVAPEAVPSTESVPPELMNTLRAAMAKLEERDWADAERGCTRKTFFSMRPGWSGPERIRWSGWISRQPGPAANSETSETYRKEPTPAFTPTTTSRISITRPMDI